MKFRVTFKDPDGVSDSIQAAADQSTADITGLAENERDAVIAHRAKEFCEAISPWVEYSEYLTVEFDTEAKTAIVVPKE